MNESNSEKGKNILLNKSLDILSCFTKDRPWLGVIEISKMLDLNKSNVHNILKTLESYGYVQQDIVTSKYALGYEILKRSYAVTSTMTHYDKIIPHLRFLAEQTKEVAYYAILYDYNVLYLEQVTVANTLTLLASRPMAGLTAPLYCTSLGKAMLAFMPEEYIEQVLNMPRIAFTDTTITDREKLYKELVRVKNLGYAVDNAEHDIGIKCVGVPLLDAKQNLVGAISLVGLASRYTDEAIANYAKIMMEQSFQLRNKL